MSQKFGKNFLEYFQEYIFRMPWSVLLIYTFLYNFNQVHFTGPDRGVEGMVALTLPLDPFIISYAEIRVGREYEVDFGPRGYAVGFTPVKI